MANFFSGMKTLFIEHLKILISPKKTFKGMHKEKSVFSKSILWIILYSLLGASISFLWYQIKLDIIAGFEIFGTTWDYFIFILSPILMLIFFFTGNLLLYLFSYVGGAKTTFKKCGRITAPIFLLYPVYALLQFIYGISYYTGSLLVLLLLLYALIILYYGLAEYLDIKKIIVNIMMIILTVILIANSINIILNYIKAKSNHTIQELVEGMRGEAQQRLQTQAKIDQLFDTE